MKILFYINVLSGGGAERVMANLANRFADANHDVILVTTYETENEYYVSDKVIRCNLECKPRNNSNRILKNIERIAKLRKIIKKNAPDVVISFMEEPNFRNIIATMGTDVKTIVSVRNDPKKEYPGKVGDFIANKLLPKADGCVFQTEEAKSYFPRNLQMKSEIIFNEVKPDFFAIKRTPIKGKIVTLGRLSEQKNHKLLINSFYRIIDEFPYAVLDIYGSGNLENEITTLISELGLTDKVFLRGNTSDVESVYASADIFVLSSDYEGMPNALMEAMASGVPCISTDCPCGGPRMLISGENGILVGVGSEKELANSLRMLLIDDNKKNTFAYNARKRADSYRPEIIFEKWKAYVERIVNNEG